MHKTDFDVAVIGGGPAGASMAGYLARAGAKVVVFEQELFPRPHVGESLVPASNRVFSDLGLFDALEEARFPKKFGAIWTSTFSKKIFEHDWDGLQAQESADVRFAERPQEGVDRDYTYHVDRGLFDNVLLQHAQKLGAEVCEGVGVAGVDFGDPSCAQVKFSVGRRTYETTARIVIDASGRRTLLGSQLGVKVRDRVFDQIAFHTWFRGFDRSSATKKENFDNYIHVHFLPLKNSWIWQIPITDDITSIGVVTQKKQYVNSGHTPEKFFWEWVRTRPELEAGLRASEQMRPLKSEGDYSYAMKQISGDRWLMIGDAARFVDPIFSSGVSIALNSARMAAPSILRALESDRTEAASFDDYVQTIRRGTANWYRFISLYYRLNVLFTSYLADPRYRLDVLKLLQGDVYDDTCPVLDKMAEDIRKVEEDPNHPWRRFLGELTSDDFRPDF